MLFFVDFFPRSYLFIDLLVLHQDTELTCYAFEFSKLVEPHLKPVFDKLSGDSASNLDSFDEEFIGTETFRAAKLRYLGVKFLNRHFNGRFFFDSTCYKRSKRGNCFVRFAENGEERFGQIVFLFKKQDRKTMGKLWLMLKSCQFSKRLDQWLAFFIA